MPHIFNGNSDEVSKFSLFILQMSRVSFSDGFQLGTEVDDVIKRDKNEFYKRKVIKISNITGAILTISTKELLLVSLYLIIHII